MSAPLFEKRDREREKTRIQKVWSKKRKGQIQTGRKWVDQNLGEDSDWFIFNSTRVDTTGEVDVPMLHSPSVSPTVLDDPVLLSFVAGAVAGDEKSMQANNLKE